MNDSIEKIITEMKAQAILSKGAGGLAYELCIRTEAWADRLASLAPNGEAVAWRWREYAGPNFHPDGHVWKFATHESTGPKDRQEPLFTRPGPAAEQASPKAEDVARLIGSLADDHGGDHHYDECEVCAALAPFIAAQQEKE